MNIGIIGAGHIGGNVARRLIAAGYHVRVAGRDPKKLSDLVRGLGKNASEGSSRAVSEWADVIWLAVPWTSREDAFAAAGGSGAFAGKIVVDSLNPYGDGFKVERRSQTSSQRVAKALGFGAKVVKAINTLPAHFIIDGARPAGAKDRIAVPVAGDDAKAKAVVVKLLDEMGFDAIDTGSLAHSGAQEPDQLLYGGAMTLPQLQSAMAQLSSS